MWEIIRNLMLDDGNNYRRGGARIIYVNTEILQASHVKMFGRINNSKLKFFARQLRKLKVMTHCSYHKGSYSIKSAFIKGIMFH